MPSYAVARATHPLRLGKHLPRSMRPYIRARIDGEPEGRGIVYVEVEKAPGSSPEALARTYPRYPGERRSHPDDIATAGVVGLLERQKGVVAMFRFTITLRPASNNTDYGTIHFDAATMETTRKNNRTHLTFKDAEGTEVGEVAKGYVISWSREPIVPPQAPIVVD